MEKTGNCISKAVDQSRSEEPGRGDRQQFIGSGGQVPGTPDPEASETSQGIPRPHAEYSESRYRLPQSLEAEIRTPSPRSAARAARDSERRGSRVLKRKTAPHGDGTAVAALPGQEPNPEPRRRARKPEAGSPELESRTRNSGSQGSQPLNRADILAPAREKLRELLEKALADPSSDAYTMLEIICMNHLIEAELKTREMDVMEVLRARSHGKQLAVKTAQLEAHTKHLATQTEKARLQNRMLKHDLMQIRKELRQAEEARSGGRAFDYERTLNQISAVIGLRGPEKFRYEKQEPQAS
jgi:predicted MarR family transcription regulator